MRRTERAAARSKRLMALVGAAGLVMLAALPARAQAPKGKVSADDPPPVVQFHGLTPGLSTADQVRAALGEPEHEARWYAYKLLYPAAGRDGLIDSIHTHGRDGALACAEVASVPDGYASRDQIEAKLGTAEYELKMPTFTLLDYSSGGARFVLDGDGKTIGVAYVPHLYRRVHEGARRVVDLSHLREGPQPRPDAPASVDGLRAAATQVKLTPQSPDWLNPRYQQQYQPHDDLWARILVLERGELTVAIVGVDLFGINMPHIEPMRSALREAGVDYTLFAMSHNHAAPDTIGVYGHFPQQYVEFINRQTASGVLQAKSQLAPVKEVRVASRELPMDGARVIGLIRNARNPGILDPTMSLIQVIGMDDKPLASVVHFACHVEGLEKGVVELSADFPGYMCDEITRQGGGQAVFLNGALGGMVSGDNRARTHDEARATGIELAQLAGELAEDAQPGAKFDFEMRRLAVEIPMTNPRFAPLFEQGVRPLNRGRVESEVALVTLGEAQILAMPGEVFPEVAFEMLEMMDGFPRMIVGLANDELGYIVPPYDYRSDAYEESMSMGPATAPVLVDAARRLLDGIE